MKIIKCILLATGLIVYLQAVDSKTPKLPQQQQVQPHQNDDLSSQNLHIELLKERNKLLETNNKDLLQVVYWSLGFSSIFLISFLGLIGYFSYRRYEQEKESIGLIIDSEFKTIKTEILQTFTDWSTDIVKRQTLQHEKLEQNLQAIAGNASK